MVRFTSALGLLGILIGLTSPALAAERVVVISSSAAAPPFQAAVADAIRRLPGMEIADELAPRFSRCGPAVTTGCVQKVERAEKVGLVVRVWASLNVGLLSTSSDLIDPRHGVSRSQEIEGLHADDPASIQAAANRVAAALFPEVRAEGSALVLAPLIPAPTHKPPTPAITPTPAIAPTPSVKPAVMKINVTPAPTAAANLGVTQPGPKTGPSALRITSYVLAGAAVVALGTGIAFGLQNKSAQDTYNENAQHVNDPAAVARANGARDDLSRTGTIATAAYITGGALAVSSVVLFFISRDPETPTAAMSYLPGQGPALVLSGHF